MVRRLLMLLLLSTVTIVAAAQRFVANAPATVAVGDQFRLTYTVNTQSVSGFLIGDIP